MNKKRFREPMKKIAFQVRERCLEIEARIQQSQKHDVSLAQIRRAAYEKGLADILSSTTIESQEAR